MSGKYIPNFIGGINFIGEIIVYIIYRSKRTLHYNYLPTMTVPEIIRLGMRIWRCNE